MGFLNTYRFIASHPLTRHRKSAAISRWLRWQVGSRLLHQAVVPFVGDLRMVVRNGMTGATGNIYCGLHEFEDMGFVLHFLRPGDLFVDVGANIGSYSLLAAATGARVVSFEPVPATFEALRDNININLNRIGSQVDARNQAVGASVGKLTMIADQDTMNKAVGASYYRGQTIEVPQTTLDDALKQSGAPKLIKIDVEGFETEVLRGAQAIMADEQVQAVVMELNGSGSQYGFDENQVHQQMLAFGFRSCGYDPLKRQITDFDAERSDRSNTLYLRNWEAAQAEITNASTYRVVGVDL